MRTENYLPAVREQYEDYPFPNVDPDVEYRFLQMMPQDSLANIVHQCFGGSKLINENFRVLVAGGGTGPRRCVLDVPASLDAVIGLRSQEVGVDDVIGQHVAW